MTVESGYWSNLRVGTLETLGTQIPVFSSWDEAEWCLILIKFSKRLTGQNGTIFSKERQMFLSLKYTPY